MLVETMVTTPSDDDFLLHVYASTRSDELAAWGWPAAAQEAFLVMQFRAQNLSYTQQYPRADHRIIRVDGQPAGRLLVDRSPAAIRLVDIALLPAFRGRGIGTHVIRELQAEAGLAGVPLCLQVMTTNPVRFLYQRLGFTVTGTTELYAQMEWTATT